MLLRFYRAYTISILTSVALLGVLSLGAVIWHKQQVRHAAASTAHQQTTKATQTLRQLDARLARAAQISAEAQVAGEQTTAPSVPAVPPTSLSPAAKSVTVQSTKSFPKTHPAPKPPATPYVPPTAAPLAVTALTVSKAETISCNSEGIGSFHSFFMSFNNYNAGGKVVANWEYEAAPGNQVGKLPSFAPITVGANTVGYGDDVQAFSNRLYYHPFEYRARLHVTSPNSFYSNWITMPARTAC